MILSRYTIHNISSDAVQVPDEDLFLLPEKVLQFGSGELLRGLADYWIDKANRQGVFNGRIVVVEAGWNETAIFEKQDCLYTIQLKKEQGERVEYSINAAISRVLPAKEEWRQVLECAHNPEMKVVLSHTSAEALQLVNDDVRLHPPKTFAGKLLAFLFERFKAFGGSPQSGMVIIPTEAVPENGKKLEAIVFELAHLNGLEDGFIEWLESSNQFCNSSVEGLADNGINKATQVTLNEQFGYSDPLLIVTEQNRTWTIEGDESLKKVVSFAQAGEGVKIAPGMAQQNAGNLLES